MDSSDSIYNRLKAPSDKLIFGKSLALPLITKAESFDYLPDISATIGPLTLANLKSLLKKLFWTSKFKLIGSVHIIKDEVIIFTYLVERKFALFRYIYIQKKRWDKRFLLEKGRIPSDVEEKFVYEILFYLLEITNG